MSIPGLHDELLPEILSWLPVKSLVQLKCVCKSWKSLISRPTFVKLHLRRSPKHANLLLSYHSNNLTYFAVTCTTRSLLHNPSLTAVAKDGSRFPLKSLYSIAGSCNGLFCLRKSVFYQVSDDDNWVYKNWVRFWNLDLRLTSKKSPCLLLTEFIETEEPAMFGFGYDDSSDSYKVIALILGLNKTTVKVFRMGDTCWRDILTLPVFPFLTYQVDGQFVSDTLNWLAFDIVGIRYYSLSNLVSVSQLVIFSLHLGKLTHKHLLLPEGFYALPRSTCHPWLGVLRDCVCLSYNYNTTNFVLWQMKEFGFQKSWTQLVNLDYNCCPKPIYLSDDGDAVILSQDYKNTILYTRRDNKDLCIEERYHVPRMHWTLDAVDYIQSLVLPY